MKEEKNGRVGIMSRNALTVDAGSILIYVAKCPPLSTSVNHLAATLGLLGLAFVLGLSFRLG